MSDAPAPAKIAGYRELTEEEVGAINVSKGQEDQIAVLLASVRSLAVDAKDAAALRWTALAATAFEEGFMWLNQAIARPTNGIGRMVTQGQKVEG